MLAHFATFYCTDLHVKRLRTVMFLFGKASKHQQERNPKRTASGEDLLPASAPAVKLHKDASGDIATAATATAEVPADPADTVPAPASPELSAILARMATLEQTTTQLQQTTTQLQTELQQEKLNSIARENAIKDGYRQQIADLKSKVEFLDQRVRSKNMVLHGIPDTAALSRPADLEVFVKGRLDGAYHGRGPANVSQHITSVSHMGRPNNGSRSVLVEYASTQAKHRAYALSRELRRQGIHLSDELTPAQLRHRRPWSLMSLPSDPRGTGLGFDVARCFTPTGVSPDSARRVRLPVCLFTHLLQTLLAQVPLPTGALHSAVVTMGSQPRCMLLSGGTAPHALGAPPMHRLHVAVRVHHHLFPLHQPPLQPRLLQLRAPLLCNRGLPANNNGVSNSQ